MYFYNAPYPNKLLRETTEIKVLSFCSLININIKKHNYQERFS